MSVLRDDKKESVIKPIAFYLPQYHPIPENDRWWGPGFTEWTNVAKAQPLFRGHYQPHVPADLGFYDLRLPEAREAQAALAKEYGIYGFCYYHYWFNGRRILERPFDEVLSSGTPDFPFCLCWANENWTRVWDGGNKEVLLGQNFNLEDDRTHIRHLLKVFEDPRYIRVNGKPLFLVYRTDLLPDPRRTADVWREEAMRAGAGELFLARVESFVAGIDPSTIGFDAAIEFAPDWRNMGRGKLVGIASRLLRMIGLRNALSSQTVVDYGRMVHKMLHKATPSYPLFRCVCPSFDNSPRRTSEAAIICGSTPDLYEEWLSSIIERTCKIHGTGERLVFINAWNEWGEGNHLEPDQKWGRSYLEKTKMALQKKCHWEAANG